MPKVGPALSPRPKKIPTESNLAKIENPPPHRSSAWPHLHNRMYPGKEEWIPTCNCSQNSLHQSRTCTRNQFSDLVLVLGWSVLHRAWVNNVRQRTWLKAKMICSATLVAWIVYYVRPRQSKSLQFQLINSIRKHFRSEEERIPDKGWKR